MKEAVTWSFGVSERATFPDTVAVSHDTIVVNLSALPKGAKVFRAVLRCRREGRHRDKVVVVAAGRHGEPLPLLSPRFACLDATGPVHRFYSRGGILPRVSRGWKPFLQSLILAQLAFLKIG